MDVASHHWCLVFTQRRSTIRHDLKSRSLRRLFVEELRVYVVPPPQSALTTGIIADGKLGQAVYDQRALLTWEQFELVVDLIDEAMCQESLSEETGIAPVVMNLCFVFYTVSECFAHPTPTH